MYTLPQLLEEDYNQINAILGELLAKTEATTIVLTDKAGFRLAEQGDVEQIDTTSLGSLASGSFMATQEIARIIHEPNFNSVYQQGEKRSMLVSNVDEYSVLIIIFPAHVSAGAVKFYAGPALQALAQRLKVAKERAPGEGLDLSMLNIADSQELFRRKPSPADPPQS